MTSLDDAHSSGQPPQNQGTQEVAVFRREVGELASSVLRVTEAIHSIENSTGRALVGREVSPGRRVTLLTLRCTQANQERLEILQVGMITSVINSTEALRDRLNSVQIGSTGWIVPMGLSGILHLFHSRKCGAGRCRVESEAIANNSVTDSFTMLQVDFPSLCCKFATSSVRQESSWHS